MIYSSTWLNQLRLTEDVIKQRLENVLETSISDIPVVIVGNKCDLHHRREVETKQGSDLADKWNCPFFESSAKHNINVHVIFEQIVREIKQQRNHGMNAGKQTENDAQCKCLIL